MLLQAAILITAIVLMVYGLVQRLWYDEEFLFRPIGNVIGSIGLTLALSAGFDLAFQESAIVFIVLVLVLYWLPRHTQGPRPKTKLTFEQVFDLVEDLEPTAPAEAEPVAPIASTPAETPEPVPTLIWKGA